jgi:hypothetical protein
MDRISLRDVADLLQADNRDHKAYTQMVDGLVDPTSQVEIGFALVADQWLKNPEINQDPELLKTAMAVSHFGAFLVGLRLGEKLATDR